MFKVCIVNVGAFVCLGDQVIAGVEDLIAPPTR